MACSVATNHKFRCGWKIPRSEICSDYPPAGREKIEISLFLTIENFANFSMGTGDAKGERVDRVDGDDIFDTGGCLKNIDTIVTIVTARVGCGSE